MSHIMLFLGSFVIRGKNRKHPPLVGTPVLHENNSSLRPTKPKWLYHHEDDHDPL